MLTSAVHAENNETLTANQTIELQEEALSKLEDLLDEYQTILYRLELKDSTQKVSRNWNYDFTNTQARPDPVKTKYTPDQAAKKLRHIDALFPYYEHFINDTSDKIDRENSENIQHLLTLKINKIDAKLSELKSANNGVRVSGSFFVGVLALSSVLMTKINN